MEGMKPSARNPAPSHGPLKQCWQARRGGAISVTSDSGKNQRYQTQSVTGPVRSIGIAPNRLPTSWKRKPSIRRIRSAGTAIGLMTRQSNSTGTNRTKSREDKYEKPQKKETTSTPTERKILSQKRSRAALINFTWSEAATPAMTPKIGCKQSGN
jgi:hypothetical protein